MRLLLVEDDADLLAGLARALRRRGYAVDTAADGEEGLAKALDTAYDAIVLDLMLPRLDGSQVLARLRRTRQTPVLMLTARDTRQDRVSSLDAGADDYLAKPFDLEELAARLRAIIRRGAGHAASILELGDVRINTAARTVQVAGTPVDLTPREYGLLEYLALHRGQVVTRTDLWEHLYDENDDGMSNAIDVHVSHVRRKLGRDLITTRRGMGYLIP